MDWKDGLIAAAVVGLGYWGIKSITNEKDEATAAESCELCAVSYTHIPDHTKLS